ncbi:MAG: hypothetical protein A2042_01685 [Candidatus Schekmanbacteria bacterium GWA2_38_11]|uniref:Uncharacterized protein n=1 Tax=Candidatus Schekmanbacteria bacterium GWA2_38_11 TaxID=1817876 RepID=A0A1F7RP76_9BACT|nr:MAG: hypothetical protein A2042_01685 [Candidatus Schekmanbacteria bacterium GWA2_38_11]
MNVLLTTSAAPDFSPFSTKEKRFPLGLGFLISVLKEAGHNVYFLDNYLNPTNFYETDYLIENKIDMVGIYASTICYRDTLKMFHALEKMRRKGKWKGKIVVGGPHTSVAPDTIPDFVDYIVQGEGEKAVLDVIDGKTERFARGERIEDLDSLPMPAWDYFVKLPYCDSVEWIKDRPIFNMNTSRGCPFSCNFCSVGSIWGKTYTFMSSRRIYNDIVYLKKKYNIKGIYFREDNFTLSKKRLTDFCELLLKNNVNIKWACETRVDALENNVIKLMHRAGCRALYIGIESGSERLLSFIKKNISFEDVKRVFKKCREIGIKTAASFMVGIPTETLEERTQTLALSEEIKADTTWINIFVGIPRSELYEYIIENSLFQYRDKNGLLYLKDHNQLVDQFYAGKASAKIPTLNNKIKYLFYDFGQRFKGNV